MLSTGVSDSIEVCTCLQVRGGTSHEYEIEDESHRRKVRHAVRGTRYGMTPLYEYTHKDTRAMFGRARDSRFEWTQVRVQPHRTQTSLSRNARTRHRVRRNCPVTRQMVPESRSIQEQVQCHCNDDLGSRLEESQHDQAWNHSPRQQAYSHGGATACCLQHHARAWRRLGPF